MTRVAVVGAGIMGANHARVLRRLPEAELTLVVDPDERRGRALAASVGARYSADPAAVAEVAEAAVVAVPSEVHADVGVPLLRAGVDLLVEKPIATTVEDADVLVEVARENDRVLMVGHIERFNPAVLQLDDIVQDLLHLELTRMGPFSPRKSANGPSMIRTVSPSANDILTLGASAVIPLRMFWTSASERGTGLLLTLTKPVTPGVLRRAYHVSSSIIIRTNT